MNDLTERRERCRITEHSVPVLSDYVRLHHDKARKRWVLLAPERLLELDEPALDILKRCDGRTAVKEIAAELAGVYDAPAERIAPDAVAMLQDLADKGLLCGDERE